VAGQDLRRLIVELVPHADAGDRSLWRGDQDERPLSDLGSRQAELICRDLRSEPIDGLYASPALRSRQTIEPLANGGLELVVLSDLREESTGEPFGGLSTRALAALDSIRDRHLEGRVVACSHGDLIPALAGRISSTLGQHVKPLIHRGQRYRIEMTDSISAIERHEIADFPR
jgi:broad specificity phosphatase PhoE